jgi:hypothetical protein
MSIHRLFQTPHDYLTYKALYADLADWLLLTPDSFKYNCEIKLGSDHHYRQTFILELVYKLKYKAQVPNTNTIPMTTISKLPSPRKLPPSCLPVMLLAKTIDLDLDPQTPLPLPWLKELTYHMPRQLRDIMDNYEHPTESSRQPIKQTYSDTGRQIRNSPCLTVLDIPCAFKQYLRPSNRIYNQATPTPSAELGRIREIDRLEAKLQNLAQSKRHERDQLITLQDRITSLVIKRGGCYPEENTRRKLKKAWREREDNYLSISVRGEDGEWLRDSIGNLITKSLDVTVAENMLNDDYAEEEALREEKRESQILRHRILYDIRAAKARIEELNKYPNDVVDTTHKVKIKRYYDGQATKQSWLSEIPEEFHWLAETSEPNIKKGQFLPPFHLVRETDEIPNVPIFTLSPGGGLPGDFIYTDIVEFDRAVGTNFYRVFVLASRNLYRDAVFREIVRMINASNGVVLLV